MACMTCRRVHGHEGAVLRHRLANGPALPRSRHSTVPAPVLASPAPGPLVFQRMPPVPAMSRWRAPSSPRGEQHAPRALPRAAGSTVCSAPASSRSVQMATSAACAAQDSGGGSGAPAPSSAPATTVTVVPAPGRVPCSRRGMRSFHSMVKCGCTILGGGQVQPDLEQLQRIRRAGIEQREHLRMLYAPPRGKPLHIAAAKARGRAQRVGVVDQALAHQRHGLEAPVRVTRKAGHALAVVHRKAVLAAEVAAHLAPVQLHGLHAQGAVARRVGVVMVGAEQERIQRGPLRSKRLGVQDGAGGGAHGAGLSWSGLRRHAARHGAYMGSAEGFAQPPAAQQCGPWVGRWQGHLSSQICL